MHDGRCHLDDRAAEVHVSEGFKPPWCGDRPHSALVAGGMVGFVIGYTTIAVCLWLASGFRIDDLDNLSTCRIDLV